MRDDRRTPDDPPGSDPLPGMESDHDPRTVHGTGTNPGRETRTDSVHTPVSSSESGTGAVHTTDSRTSDDDGGPAAYTRADTRVRGCAVGMTSPGTVTTTRPPTT